MQKRLLSILLSFVILLSCLISTVSNAQTYEEQLISQGIPKSYASLLSALHTKYPNWVFKPFITNLDWQTAVNGERSTHSKQRIQKQSGKSEAFYCQCEQCYDKVKKQYKMYEVTYVSASEATVKYYLDPRNWLNEKYIFQFESNEYDLSQTQSGVEAIIANTWMKNADITYLTTGLNQKTYTSNGSTVKYSKAIVDAGKNSGLSPYYLASKIVQEVGGAKPTAGGVCGNRVPFTGIYNYYNIGAYGGADDGLAWAAGFMLALNDTKLYESYDSTKKTVTGKATDIKKNQRMTWMDTKGDYYKVRLYNDLGSDSYSKDGAIGYVLKTDCRTTYFNYNRPWTNPYKAIYNGAVWVANSFKYQNTAYLQKFNVNPDSYSLYSNEYMTNIEGASSEAYIKYTAYKNNNILSSKKIFYIPVFNNMPDKASPRPDNVQTTTSSATGSTTTTTTTTKPSTTTPVSKPSKVTGLTSSSNTTSSITIKWNKVSGAKGYYVYRYSSKTKKYTKVATVSSSTNTYKQSKLNPGSGYSYAVCAYNSAGVGAKSAIFATATKPSTVTILTPKSAAKNHTITAKWKSLSACTGYQVQYSRQKDFSKVIATKTVSSKSKTSYVGKNFTKGVTYYVRVRAYKTGGTKKYYGSWSTAKSIKAK